MHGYYEILNTATEYSRRLARRHMIKGPFRETKAFSWKAEEEKMQLSAKTQEVMTTVLEESRATKESKSTFVTLNSKDDHIFCVQLPTRGALT